jgi:hypothetical protein
MADDGVIRIGTEVDISGIQNGMKEAQATVSESTSEMQSAYERLAAATAEYSVTQANLRNSIAQVVTGQTAYSNATEALTPALMENTAAANSLRDAKAALAAIETEETAIVRESMSARMAATAEMRVLEGNIQGSTRAAAAFLTTIPGVGEAMQGAFAVFGAVALAGVVVDLGEKLYTAFDIGGERARKTQQDIAAVTREIERSTTSLNVQIDRLQQEQAKLEHVPFNGIKLVLDEASEAAQKLAEQLDQVAERQKAVIAGMSASMPQRMLGGAQTGYEQTMVSEHAKWIAQAKTQQDQLNESVSYGNSLQTRLAELKSRQAAADAAAAGSNGETGIVANYSREIQAVQQMVQWQQQEQAQIKATIALNQQQAATQGARDAHGATSIDNSQQRAAQEAVRKAVAAQKAAQEAAIQADRQNLDEMKSLHAMTAEDEANYWMGVAMQATSGSREYTTAIDEANKALGRYQQETAELSQRVGQQLRETWDAAQKAAEDATKKQQELANATAEAAQRMVSAQQGAANAVAEANLRAGEASGGITKLAAAQKEAQLHALAYREELERLDAELTKVSQDQALTPQQRTQQVGQLQSQKVQVQGQQQAAGISDQANIQQQIAQPYLNAFNQINQGWLQVQNKMMFSTRDLGLAFAKMGQQLFISIVDNLEKAALVAVEKEMVMRLAHTATVTTNVATDASGAAASTAISTSTNMMQGLNAAKLAFKNTYGVVSGWPVVGPILAPVLAAGAFAAVAAFEDGTGYVPRDGMAYLHEGEAVVPAPTMDQLRGSDGSGGALTINHTTNINGHSDKAVIAAIQRNPHEIAGALRKHIRQGGRV